MYLASSESEDLNQGLFAFIVFHDGGNRYFWYLHR